MNTITITPYVDAAHRGQMVALWEAIFAYEAAHNNPNGIEAFSPGLRGTSYPEFRKFTTLKGLNLGSKRFAIQPFQGCGTSLPLPRVGPLESGQPWAE
jgi:hypothetical protein